METLGLILKNICLILEACSIYIFSSSSYNFEKRVYAGISTIIILIYYFNI